MARKLALGDLILSRENTWASWVVRIVTRSEWSHVGVYNGEGKFISAVPFEGVCEKKLDSIEDKAVYRLKTVTDAQRKAICQFCRERLGCPYDFVQVILLAYRIFTDQLKSNAGDPHPNQYVCSELVAEACASQGIYFGKVVDNVLPQTIAKSELVERIE